MTASDAVTAAMRLLNIIPAGQIPSPDETLVGVNALNRMIGLWNAALSKALAGSYASVLYTFHPIAAVASSSDAISADPGWQKAIVFNLAVDLSPEFGRPPEPQVIAIATQSKQAVMTIPTPTVI